MEETLAIRCMPEMLRYPQKSKFEDLKTGTWVIASMIVTKVISGEFSDIANRIYIRGKIPFPLCKEKVYYVELSVTADETYGHKYTIKEMKVPQEIEEEGEREVFMRHIFTDRRFNLVTQNLKNPYEVLRNNDIKTLCKIKGIGQKTAQNLVESFNKHILDADMVITLNEKFGLTENCVNKLMGIYKNTQDIINALENNPYKALMRLDGYGFKKADEIALRIGIAKNDIRRVEGYTKYYFKKQADECGNTWVVLDEFVDSLKKELITISNKELSEILKDWTGRNGNNSKDAWLYYDPNGRRIGLQEDRKTEEKICHELLRIKNAPVKKFNEEEFERTILACEKENGWEYTDEQKKAIYGCFTNNIVIITGYAGTGKSSVMKPLTQFLRDHSLGFRQCSLAGKAASNLSEITNSDGETIHRLLEYRGYKNSTDEEKGADKFFYNENNKLKTDLIIIDEMSMNDNYIFSKLISAVEDGTKIVILGDINQLEPVGTGNLLKDMIDSELIPYFHLTQIMRQAAKSGIITESLKVAKGIGITKSIPESKICGELQDLKILTYHNERECEDRNIRARQYFMREYQNLLNEGIKPADILGVVPMKDRGMICCLDMNKNIQCIVNNDETKESIRVSLVTKNDTDEVVSKVIERQDELSDEEKKIEYINDKSYFILRLDDKVVNRKNHYKAIKYTKDVAELTEDEINEISADELESVYEVEPIYNGNVGFITKIIGRHVVVNFKQQGEILITKEYVGNLMLGYVLTCHSAQGSQSPYVVVGIDNSAYVLLSKEWLYTALSRARKYCVLTGEVSAINKAVRTSKVSKKNTWLKELLKESGDSKDWMKKYYQ